MNIDLLLKLDKLIIQMNKSNINDIINNIEINNLLNELFYDVYQTVDINFIETLEISKTTFLVIKKYCINNNIKMKIDDNKTIDITNEYFKEIKNMPVLDNEIQKELLIKHQELKEKSDKYIIQIIGQYYDLMYNNAKRIELKQITDEKTKNELLIDYQIDILYEAINNCKIKSFNPKYIEMLLNKSMKKNTFTTDKKKYDLNIFKVNKLKPDEFNNLIKAYNTNENERLKIRKTVATHNLRLVLSIAKNFQNRGIELTDLIQEGNIGLLKAIDKFKTEKGEALSTYATYWIRQSILRAIYDKSKAIRIPCHINNRLNKYNTFIYDYFQKHNEYPSNEQIMQGLNINEKELLELKINSMQPVSLEDPINGDDGDSSDELGDLIEDKKTNVEKTVMNNQITETAMYLLDKLQPREKAILILRYGIKLNEPYVFLNSNNVIYILTSDIVKNEEVKDYLCKFKRFEYVFKINDGYNFKVCHLTGKEFILEDIGSIFDLTRERVRQIEIKTLIKLKNSKDNIKYKSLLKD